MAILACYYAMTVAVGDHWIFQGMAEHEIRGLYSLLPAEWKWAMEWPLKVLEIGKVS